MAREAGAGQLRWGVEARAGFLAALGRIGTVKGACAAVGLSVPGAYDLRRRDAGFAAEWDGAAGRVKEAVDAARAAAERRGKAGSGARLPGYRVRHDGWTEGRRKAFLLALSQTGCVRDACKRARISSNSAYRLRKLAPEFAQAWDRAIAKAAPTIEAAAFTRAVEGWDEVVERDGQEVSRKRRYSDSLLRVLLVRGDLKGDRKGMSKGELADFARETAQMAGGRFVHPDEDGAARAGLEAKLAQMHERMLADDAARPDCGQAKPAVPGAADGGCSGDERV